MVETIKTIKINSEDNVAVAITDLKKGEKVKVGAETIEILEDVPAGHKILLEDCRKNENLIKYGYPIGQLTEDKKKGEKVDHTCIRTNLKGTLEYEYSPVDTTLDIENRGITFKGYRRKNGDVGIRNEIWIVPTVGCVNGVAEKLAKKLQEETGNRNEGKDNVDRITAFTHNYGCSQLSGDHENTRNILKDIVLHPNAGGVLVVGLGCENNQPDKFEELLGCYDKSRIKFMVCQKVEGDEIEEGMKILRGLYAQASSDKRTDIPLAELKVGLKCGGSDGLSGITANPLLGRFSDFIVAQGGTTVLTEVPEMFGAETILMNRCADRTLFDKTVKMINDFKNYFLSHGEPVGENPSPGNKEGGISTLEEKALGCTQKCGKSAVRGVLTYGERLKEKGLNLLEAPGNDLVASTALASCGCHIVLFTTGRGTPFGTFVPTMKISTNSHLFNNKPKWIDFNAGTLVEGKSWDEASEEFINAVISIANGQKTWNEKNDYQEIAIFKSGVTL